MRKILAAIMLLTTFTVWAGDYEDGMAAYEKHHFSTAIKKFESAADKGNAKAMSALGNMYLHGQGVNKNFLLALGWFSLANGQNDAFAQHNLGWLYIEGRRGITRDIPYAISFYRKAAAQGYAPSQNELGRMYEKGQHVAQNYTEALRWYKLAADQGFANAQLNLGRMYDRGWAVAQDDAEAVRWYKLAAANKDIDAQFNLALMYERGRGIAQNLTQAHVWFNLAAAQGDKEAAEQRNRVAKMMTSQQITQAQKLATECLARNYKRCD